MKISLSATPDSDMGCIDGRWPRASAGRPRPIRRVENDLQHHEGTQTRVHFWLFWPLQVQICALVPLAVPPPATFRHLFAPTAVMVPSALRRHFWLFCPLQSQMITDVPSAVP